MALDLCGCGLTPDAAGPQDAKETMRRGAVAARLIAFLAVRLIAVAPVTAIAKGGGAQCCSVDQGRADAFAKFLQAEARRWLWKRLAIVRVLGR